MKRFPFFPFPEINFFFCVPFTGSCPAFLLQEIWHQYFNHCFQKARLFLYSESLQYAAWQRPFTSFEILIKKDSMELHLDLGKAALYKMLKPKSFVHFCLKQFEVFMDQEVRINLQPHFPKWTQKNENQLREFLQLSWIHISKVLNQLFPAMSKLTDSKIHIVCKSDKISRIYTGFYREKKKGGVNHFFSCYTKMNPKHFMG